MLYITCTNKRKEGTKLLKMLREAGREGEIPQINLFFYMFLLVKKGPYLNGKNCRIRKVLFLYNALPNFPH